MSLPTVIVRKDWGKSSAPPVAPSVSPLYKDGQFYISSNGSIFRHYKFEDDRLILAPANVIVHEDSKSANDRNKREMLERLRLLIEMRDLTMGILHLQESTPDESITLPWKDLQTRLEKKYKIFLETFGPIYKTENDSLHPNLRTFRKDPDAHRIASLIENYDDETGYVSMGDIFSSRILPYRVGTNGLSFSGEFIASHQPQIAMEMREWGHFSKPCFVLSEENFLPFTRQFFKLYPLADLFVIDQDQWKDNDSRLSVDEKMQRFLSKANNNSWHGILIMPVHFKKLVTHKYFDQMDADHYFIDESIQSRTIESVSKIDENLLSKFRVQEKKDPVDLIRYNVPSLAA